MTAAEFIKSKGFLFSPVFDRRLRKFDRNGKDQTAWHIGKIIECPGGSFEHLAFGDFADVQANGKGAKYNWYSRASASNVDQAEINAAIAEDDRKYREERDAKHLGAAKRVREIWSTLVEATPGPEKLSLYAVAKGLTAHHGAKTNASGDLCVPMYDVRGLLWNLQRIAPLGGKGFFRGGKILGNFFTMGDIAQEGTIYVCEGYATGASIFESLQACGLRETKSLRQEAGDHAASAPAAHSSRGAGVARGSLESEPVDPREAFIDHFKGMVLSALGNTAGEALEAIAAANAQPYAAHPRSHDEPGPRLGRVDLGQPGVVGREVLEVLPTRRPLAPPPDGVSPRSREAGRGADGRGAVAGGVAQHCGGSARARSEVLTQPTRGAGRPVDSRASDPADRAGPDAPARGPGVSDEQQLAQAGDSDGDRRRRRRALEWKPGQSEAGQERVQSEGLPRSGDDSQAVGTPRPCVVVAFNTANLPCVVKALRTRYPLRQIVVAADDDIWGKTDTGAPAPNAGRLTALKAARENSCQVVFPRFGDLLDGSRGRPTDFNDLACLVGLQAVAQCLVADVVWPDQPHLVVDQPGAASSPVVKAPDLNAGRGDGDTGQLEEPRPFAGEEGEASTQPEEGEELVDLGTPLTGMTAKGTPTMPPHQHIVERMLGAFRGKLIKQDRDLFRYVGTHWKHLSMGEIDQLKQGVQRLCDGIAKARDLAQIWELFVMHLPGVTEGRNMFTPDPWSANFLNGTLKVTRTPKGYGSSFHVHRANDYLVNVLPLNYPSCPILTGSHAADNLPVADSVGQIAAKVVEESRRDDTQVEQLGEFDARANLEPVRAVNPVFEEMLDRVFDGDADRAEKRRAVAQMYGACLLPAFAHLFMLYGEPGTGKSTVIKLAVRLVSQGNASSVQPCDFIKFGLSSMAGKLVNYDTDIDTNLPIADHIVKKIEDRIPIRIERKNLTDLYAPLPSVHIFGGNKIPPTRDGASRAHDRRWSFLGFHKILTSEGTHDLDYAEKCWDAGPDGILAFALEGLRDLLESRGHFVNPQSGKDKMEEWQMSGDPVGQFLSAVDHGEVLEGSSVLTRAPGVEIERARVYGLFSAWSKAMAPSDRVMSSIRFYERMAGHGFKSFRVTRGRFFSGLVVGAAPNTKY